MVQLFTRLFFLSSLTFFSIQASAEVLFEGYYKIQAGPDQIGFVAQRFSFDKKSKQFQLVSLTKQKTEGVDYTDSLKASSSDELAPIAYEYTNINNKKIKTIDVKYNKNKMSGTINNHGEKSTIKGDIPKGAFLSNFLVYMILKSPKGLQENSNYKYKAIFEETGDIGDGEAQVGKKEKWNGIEALKVVNKFGTYTYINYITEKGEVLYSKDENQPLSLELVASKSEAIQNFKVSDEVFKTLFGEVPEGTANVMALRAQAGALPEPSKQVGVPQGQNMMLKSGPTESVPQKKKAKTK